MVAFLISFLDNNPKYLYLRSPSTHINTTHVCSGRPTAISHIVIFVWRRRIPPEHGMADTLYFISIKTSNPVRKSCVFDTSNALVLWLCTPFALNLFNKVSFNDDFVKKSVNTQKGFN